MTTDHTLDMSGAEKGQHNKQGSVEDKAKQLYRRPKMASFFWGTHKVRDELQLSHNCGLGPRVRVKVLGSVNSNHNHIPKHIYNPNPTLTLILTLTLNLP